MASFCLLDGRPVIEGLAEGLREGDAWRIHRYLFATSLTRP